MIWLNNSPNIESNTVTEFVGAKTAFNSIQGEKNELKVQIMTLTSRLTEADTEKEELKTQNALLVIENEKIKTNSFRHKHENICKWKEEQALKAQIADLEKTAEQKVYIFVHLSIFNHTD